MDTSPTDTPISPNIEKYGRQYHIDNIELAKENQTEEHSSLTFAKFGKRLCLKIDLHVLLPMFFLNLLSLMGRTNIGAALIQELIPDLHLTSMDVFLVIAITTVPIMVLDIPSQLLMRYLGRKVGLPFIRYLCLMDILLGIVTIAQGFDRTYGQMLATRFLVGIFEAGLIPGCVYVLGLYYPGVHLQWRLTMIMVANISASMVGNILAYAVAEVHTSNGFHGWRWIFIVEGSLTAFAALICSFSSVSEPEHARFLSPSEKAVIAANVEVHVHQHEQTTSNISITAEWTIFLRNPLNYVWTVLYAIACTTTSSVAVFAPTLVQTFHKGGGVGGQGAGTASSYYYTVPQVQAQVVPIFAASALVTLLVAWLADRTDHRCGFATAGYLLSLVGYAVLRFEPEPPGGGGGSYATDNPAVAMAALYLVSIGAYVSLPMIWTLTLLNSATPFQRAIACGFVVGIGNVAGFISSWLFRTSQAPHYRDGMTDSLILTAVGVALLVSTWVFIVVHNRREQNGPLGRKEGVVAKYRC